ncbi:MAG: thiosulfohydrolase SoxB [Proteobacteria bacterium]|nr:thiosulfohydrolase SoxB [Pseudomonadota bacterium]
MYLTRRQFLSLLNAAAVAGILPSSRGLKAGRSTDVYEVPKKGNVRLLHITDCHAQLLPVYFREPSVNIGVGNARGKAPHLVGTHLLDRFDLNPANRMAVHAFTFLDFIDAAKKYGKVGGFAHLCTLVKKLRHEFGEENTLLLDGGDTWQGSGTAYWTRGRDMVNACNLLGVDVMTGHWEFTYHDKEVMENIQAFNGEFIAQNVKLTEDGFFEDQPAYDENTGHIFKPYTIKELGGVRIAVIGQAFPYTPIANPRRFIPYWSFGIRDDEMQEVVNVIHEHEKPAAVVLISHNGMDVDLKMASRVTGLTAIFGGHTHDGVPQAVEVNNANGVTLVTNAGSNAKFLGVMDLEIKNNRVSGYSYRLLPVFSNLLDADPEMAAYIEKVRNPYLDRLEEKLGVADSLLYRRGNFNGSFDQVICDALIEQLDTQIALSPGFRWGVSVLPGDDITMEHVLTQTCMTYPETYTSGMSGETIKLILEDVCDNLFNPDPYYQQGGDMVRLGGMNYVCDPTASAGNRISDMTLDSGEKIEANKIYQVAGWATVGSKSQGPPVWDVVAQYIREHKSIRVSNLNTPKLKNLGANPGISDYRV